MKQLRALPHLRLWQWLGRLWLAATVVVCLIPMPRPPIHVEDGDKYEHVLGWLLITLWYAQLTASWRALLARACGFLALGGFIELAQSLTTWRSADFADLIANAAGIGLGLVLASTPLSRLLERLDR